MTPIPAFLLAAVQDGDNIPLAMLVAFGSAKLFAEAFELVKQPGIVGEIRIVIAITGWAAASWAPGARSIAASLCARAPSA